MGINMKLQKMYYYAMTKRLIISWSCMVLSLFLFTIDDLKDKISSELILLCKIILILLFFIGLFILLYYIYRKEVLKKNIKINKVITKEVHIIDVNDISIFAGYRNCNKRFYYGIEIKTKVNNKIKSYLFLYKEILTEKSDFTIYYKLEKYKYKNIKIEVYENTNVIKKIKTNI